MLLSVDAALTSLPIGALCQILYMLALPYVDLLSSLVRFDVKFALSPDIPRQSYPASAPWELL